MTFVLACQFHMYLPWVSAHLPWCLNSVSNMNALVGTFNQEKALVGAFSVIVKLQYPVFSTERRHKRSIGVFWLHFSGAPQQTQQTPHYV